MQKNAVGLGTFPFANVFTHVDKNEAESIVHRFLDLGGKYIDTAPMYGFGYAEELLGNILRYIPRNRYHIATKCGYVWNDSKQAIPSSKYEDVISECDKSLRRLQTDYIDIYIVHTPDKNTPFLETIEALRFLKRQGKIKEIGVSNVTLEQLVQYNQTNDVRYVQNRFSLLNQSLEENFFTYCKKYKIGITPYQVIERGLLTDKIIRGLNLSTMDLRNRKPEFEAQRRIEIEEWVKQYLAPIASAIGVRISTLAIWWVINQPSVEFCICGATSVANVEENLIATKKKKSKNTLDELNKAYSIFEEKIRTEKKVTVREFLGLA